MSDFLSSLCRTCMSTHANINVGTSNTKIRNPGGGSNNNNSPTIIDLLRWVQPQIHTVNIEEDMLPKMMCLGCVEQLQTTYDFLKMCKDTDQKFRKLMQEEDFIDDDQILDYPKDLEETMQMVGVKREPIEQPGYESQIEKFEIEIYDDDPNYQQTGFDETFMYNRSGGGQDEFDVSHNPFVGNYHDETITSRQEYNLDHSSRKNQKRRELKGGIHLSGPHFFREGRGKVFQKSRTLKKRELTHPSARTKRIENISKNKRNAKVTNLMIEKDLEDYGFFAADVMYEQNSAMSRRPISVGPTCSSPACLKCKLRHCEEFTDEIRSNIFENFWNMTDAAKRKFVRDHAILVAKKRIPVENSRKQNTFVFKLPYEHLSLQVCRTMFLATLSISKNLFRAWMIEDKVISSINSKKYGKPQWS